MSDKLRIFRIFILVLTTLAIALVQGDDEIQPNSYISPKSVAQDPNNHNSQDRTVDLNDMQTSSKDVQSSSIQMNPSIVQHKRLERSADPILSKTSDGDKYIMYKNIEEALDSNDVELSGRHIDIAPSKTEGRIFENIQSSTPIPFSGEERRAPHGRSLEEPIPITPTATIPQSTASLYNHPGKARQVNPDIQDIITGIVKLLNGNVNVQANTVPAMGRPIRPLSSRINNRGPPRINDLPALPPDFDVPAPPLPPPPLGQMPPPVPSMPANRVPTPYPFDLPPPSSRPYGDQMAGNMRPGIYRPTVIPPWNNRLPQRRPGLGNRRPNPIPAYKPLPQDYISLTTDKPMEDIFNLDLGSHLESEQDNTEDNVTPKTHEDNSTLGPDLPEVTTNMILETSETVDRETLEFEKNKEKITKKDKYSVKTTSVTPTLPSPSSTSVDDATVSTQNSSSSTETPSDILEESYSPTIVDSPVENRTKEIGEISATPTDSLAIVSTPVVNVTSLDTNNKNTELSSSSLIESSVQEVLQTSKGDVMENSSNFKTPTSELLSIADSSSDVTVTSNSTVSHSTANNSQQGYSYFPYRPRPGIVLDDTEYKPGHRQPIITRPPIGQLGDIFDITVSAIQGPGGSSNGQGKPYVIPVDIENVHVGQDVITSPEGDNGFVSIDGKRTYLNLFGEVEPTKASSHNIKPSAPSHNQVTGTGYAISETVEKKPNMGSIKPTQSQRRPLYGRPKPTHPPVRIDTCIVGDDSTCDVSQHEMCLTENGVSACHCRPGFTRRKHRDVCRKIVSVLLSLRVDKLYERRVVWANELSDKSSESYQQLSYEAERALESAMSMTPFSDEFLGAKVNGIYSGERSAGQAGVFVNLTLQLEENLDTSRPTVRGDIQKHLLGVIQRRSNNVGNSALWVDSPPGSVSNLQDLDECSSQDLHDCHQFAKCINVFGGFKCECEDGYRDQFLDSKYRAGRHCEQCPSQYCNNRGECRYQSGQEICVCSGNYYGTQCELDGEVLGVAIGASVAAIIIIGLTLVALVMWSRKWQREQKASVGSPVFGYMATASNTVKAPIIGGPPYQLTLEDRLRWAQLADVMAQANHYAPEPVAPTRPSSALFGYPSLGSVQRSSMHGTLPPVPLPRLTLQAQIASRTASLHGGMKQFDNSSSSEEEDKADLLGRNFQVPRPKSRSNASIANQSGIYYDVDYDQHDIYKQGGGIPMNTYSMGRPAYFRN